MNPGYGIVRANNRNTLIGFWESSRPRLHL
jgi:hypothetical protein